MMTPAHDGKTGLVAGRQTGFTLLELLAVISLIAVLAGVALLSYDGVQDESRDDVTRFEMTQIRQALLQFRRDSGTNDFPGEGQYDCAELADRAIASRPPNWPAAIPAVNTSSKAAWVSWCSHPANFWMLFVDPRGDGWSADRKRGWNGPYLQRQSGLLTLAAGGSTGLSAMADVWGVADGHLHPVGSGIVWIPAQPANTTVRGPYLFFLDTDSDSQFDERIVSMGVDGRYAGVTASDECLPNGDDHVLCLRR